jgi:hypothetical protein
VPTLTSDLNIHYGLNVSDYLAASSTADILVSGLEAIGIASVGKIAKDSVFAIGKAGKNGALKFANQI